MVGRAVPDEPHSGTFAHGPTSLSAPFSTACISTPVQRFTFGPHSTFDSPSTISIKTMRKSVVISTSSALNFRAMARKFKAALAPRTKN